MVVLGGAPSFTLSVIDWRQNVIQCQISNGSPAKQVQFNPMDSHYFITFGYNQLKFWWIKEGYRKTSLKNVTKSESRQRMEMLNRGNEVIFSRVLGRMLDVDPVWNDKNEVVVVLNDGKVMRVGVNCECEQMDVRLNGGVLADVKYTMNGYVMCYRHKINHAVFSPSHETLAIVGSNGELTTINRETLSKEKHLFNGNKVKSMSLTSDQEILMVEDDKRLVVFNAETRQRREFHRRIEKVESEAEKEESELNEETMIFEFELKKVKRMRFDPMGRHLVVHSESGLSVFTVGLNGINFGGYLKSKGSIQSLSFYLVEEEEKFSYLIVLCHIGHESLIFRFMFPIEVMNFKPVATTEYYIPKEVIPPTDNANEIPTLISNAFNNLNGHLKRAKFYQSLNREWMITFGMDGNVMIRGILDVEKYQMIQTNEGFKDGIAEIMISPDFKWLCVLGNDGVLRLIEWKYTTNGKRLAMTVAEDVKQFYLNQFEHFSKIEKNFSLIKFEKKIKEISEIDQSETLVKRENLRDRLREIKEKIKQIIENNGRVDESERLEIEEMIIDEEKRERLTLQGIEQVDRMKSEIENENLKQEIIFRKLKSEFWDSMRVKGKSIKSFDLKIDLRNYPICEEREEEDLIKKIINLRKCQLEFERGKERVNH
ncbi:hypothetical protein ROZALSC1DRAFT_21486 [Rozella allomycis CSF55]|uniref:Cilia- and flagella-associated protein 43 n=1 Tax=Rozella allomycis (strain CSF55) TaxID=988480 RepID=A0A4P9YLG9_ROZAC|nr:hypothetical protein ROZALSC1DRAFT_21486 [Rozella allomycis CSF55]